MNLNFKKAFSDVFSLKYFWVYLFIFAVITTLSSIIQSAKVIPYNNFISNCISIFAYIATGYLFLMINNLINNKDINNNDESFIKNIIESTKKGLKAFVGTLANTLIGFICGSFVAIISVFAFIKITHNVVTEDNLFHFPVLNIIFAVIAIVLMVYMLFVLKLLAVAYCENFSLKMMFCWRKVFNRFFRKGNAKETLAAIGIYVFSIIFIFVTMFLLIFLFNFILIYFIKTLLNSHFVAVAFLINISYVIAPFFIAMFHYILSGYIFHLLGQVYKKAISE